MRNFRISSILEEQDLALIHRFLSEESAWTQGTPLETVHASMALSLGFGGFSGDGQIAFARVISAYASFAYLVDVFVLPPDRGQGYRTELISAVLAHLSDKVCAASCWPLPAHTVLCQIWFHATGQTSDPDGRL